MIAVTHTTPADGTFSSTGAGAWNAGHTVSNPGYIQGAIQTYNNAGQNGLSSGILDINGTILTFNALTIATIGETANKVYYGYAYDSGAGVVALEKSYTAVPVWDATLNYWKKTGDATRRLVMAWSTATACKPFYCEPVQGDSRKRRVVYTTTGANYALYSQTYNSGVGPVQVSTACAETIPVGALSATVQAYVGNNTGGALDLTFSVSGKNAGGAADNGPLVILVYGVVGGAITPFDTKDIPLGDGQNLWTAIDCSSGLTGDATAVFQPTGFIYEF